MDKITELYYKKYAEQINFDDLTHSVYCEMTTALLSKTMMPMWEALKLDLLPPPHRRAMQAKVDALIALMAEISAKAIVLYRKELGEREPGCDFKFIEEEIFDEEAEMDE